MSDKIYLATVTAPTNIAVIKYWGKASVQYNTPTNDSVSVTLDQTDLRAVTTVAASPSFTQDKLWLNGTEEEGAHQHKRFRACVDGVKALATDKVQEDGQVQVSKQDWQTWKVHVSSYNTFPTAAGLASSAAGYAALVAALAELYQAKETFPHELTTIARQGSGSSCRSLYGGFVAWRQGSPGDNGQWKNSLAEPIVPDQAEHHWPDIRAVILVTNADKKHTSSTAGMQASVKTSPYLQHRIQHVVPARMKAMEQAWIDKDFASFAELTMKDSNQFHATCLDTYPPIFYLNDTSRDIIRLITAYNEFYKPKQGDNNKDEEYQHLRVAYTFDAGPNAVLYTTEPYMQEILQLVSYFFPAPASGLGTDGLAYLRGLGTETKNMEAPPSALLQHCLQAMPDAYQSPTSGRVQYMYATKSGPGPQVLVPCSLASTVPADVEVNLDPKTGLNTYTAANKRKRED